MSEWQPIETAPLDGTTVLLHHRIHGAIQGWFEPLRRLETIDGTEWDGDVWVLGDDLLQEPVERYIVDDDIRLIDHGPIQAWQPLPEPPQ